MAATPVLRQRLRTFSARSSASYDLLRTQLAAVAWPTVIVTLITVAAFGQRLYLALGDSLPLGDGGMFYVVVEQIKAEGYWLPDYVSYDGMKIPFDYSPLTFYIAALLGDVLGTSSLEVLRFLPVIVSCLTIPAFYLLAKAILNRVDASLVATAFFAAHASFVKLIMGGGLTRSFGYLFAILAIYHLYRLSKDDGSPRRTLLASLCIALTVLSHQEMAWLAALFYLLILCHCVKSPRDLIYPLGVAVLTLGLISPWLAIVLERHGVEPFVGALDSGTRESLVPLGLLALPLSRRWLVPALYVASVYFGTRNLQFPMGICIALLAGWVSGWIVQRVRVRKDAAPELVRALRVVGVTGAAIAVLLLAEVSVTLTNQAIGAWVARPSGEAASFQWIKGATEPDSRFVVIADTNEWGYDHTGEWLPALTGRLTLTTVQGREWLRGPEGYPAAKEAYRLLRQCVTTTVDCLEGWRPVQNVDFTHVYITKDACCSVLRGSLAQSPDYRLAYDGAGAQIYERLNLRSRH
jgi:hypothetical protein